MKSAAACMTQRQRWGGKREELQSIVKVCSSQKTVEVYIMVMATVFHGRNPLE
jgi:hypothetical protein